MSFLNPSILFGLAAAAVPLLIHLLTRTKRRIIPFSTLRFLKEIQYQQSRRLRLRQLLLLILRTAVVALLVMAFARPTLNRAPMTGGEARTAAALIIDNSMSMNRYVKGRSLFEEAKEKALTVLRSFEAGDRIFILTATDTSAEWSRRPFAPGPLAEKQILDLKLSYKRTNLSAALQAATHRLSGLAELNKEIYIFSDLQQSGFVDPFTPPANCRVYAAACTAWETANLAIRDVAVKSLLLRGRTAEVEVMLANTGNQPLQESVARLFVNDKAAAQTSVSTVGGAETMETLRFTVETTGPMVLRVDTEDDDLLEDNRRAVSVWVPDSMVVGIAAADPQQAFYLRAALNADELQRALFQLVSLNDLNRRNLQSCNTVIVLDPAFIEESTLEDVEQFISSGNGLFLILGRTLDYRRFNNEAAPRLGLPPIEGALGGDPSRAVDFTLGPIDPTHPLFRGVFVDDSPRFSPPRFRFAWRVRPAGVESILRYSTGEPFLFEKKLGEGHIIVMTSSPDPRFTDLFRKTIFAPLITSATFHVAAAKVFTPQSASVGDELRFRVNSHLAGASFEMRRPDDLYDRLSPRLEGGSALLAYDQTDQPGIYRLYADRALLQQWAVNLPVEESVLAGLPQEELEKRFGIKWIPPQADLAVFIAEQRRGIELWRWFAGLALLLLIVEMLLYREKGEAAVETAGEMHA